LGLGYNSSITFDHLPVTVPGLNGVVAVSAGTNYTVALKSDGTVVGFGENAGGQLGYQEYGVMSYSPQVVPELNGVVAIDAGNTGTVALKSDGTVIAWGAYVIVRWRCLDSMEWWRCQRVVASSANTL
jgi:alpha-tubulin suppressor-like RCC1 family protein